MIEASFHAWWDDRTLGAGDAMTKLLLRAYSAGARSQVAVSCEDCPERCNNPLRSEITCADLVRENDNLRSQVAVSGAADDESALQLLYEGAMRWVMENAMSAHDADKIAWAPQVTDIDARARGSLMGLLRQIRAVSGAEPTCEHGRTEPHSYAAPEPFPGYTLQCDGKQRKPSMIENAFQRAASPEPNALDLADAFSEWWMEDGDDNAVGAESWAQAGWAAALRAKALDLADTFAPHDAERIAAYQRANAAPDAKALDLADERMTILRAIRGELYYVNGPNDERLEKAADTVAAALRAKATTEEKPVKP